MDDTLDSKKTLDYAINLIEKYNPKSINVAILYNFNKDTFKDIYSGKSGGVFELDNAHSFTAENLEAYNVTSTNSVKIDE